LYILGLHNGSHDASACLYRDFELIAAVSLERLARQKSAGVNASRPMPDAAIDEVLRTGGISRAEVDVVAASRALFARPLFTLGGVAALGMTIDRLRGREKPLLLVDRMMRKQRTLDPAKVFDGRRFLAENGFSRARLFFYNHHLAHGLAAYFYGPSEAALIHTADGGGDGVSYSARVGTASGIQHVFGGDERLLARKRSDSIGLMYAGFTQALGFIPNRHEGKLVGLAGHGQPVAADRIASHFRIEADGEIRADFSGNRAIAETAAAIARELSREDAAASVQEATERLIVASVRRLVEITGQRRLATAGGVYANVKMNRRLLEEVADELFIFPAMGDDGLPIGGVLEFLMAERGYPQWFAARRPLADVFWGRDHQADARELARARMDVVLRGEEDEALVSTAVEALAEGAAVALHEGRMEFGPRALGARSILASPVRRDINDSLNARLQRSEFMPFAPVALAEEADEVFDITPGMRAAARFMTITCNVKDVWRERIPAVVHVDGSARPQLLEREPRTLYRRILERWREKTGLPVLVNTSFNVHEEPIIDTPEQALHALAQNRVDLLIVGGRLFARG
jgi:carbamoyltransferase